MDVTCWNCKNVTTLDQAAVEKALAAIDASQAPFYDVPCAKCGKVNRTQRGDFEKGLKAFGPKLTQREETKKNKEERAAKRAERGH